MDKVEHDTLRHLQDRWLRLPAIDNRVVNHGEDQRIALGYPDAPWPTYRDVRTKLLPELKGWFEDYFRDG